MNEKDSIIFPDVPGMESMRKLKESLLKQHSKVIWMTGLSGAGKSSIGRRVEEKLFSLGFLTHILDGDNIRAGINYNLGFSESDRFENIRRISEVSKLFVDCGIIVIDCFISPLEQIRQMARKIIGPENFIEVYINAPIEVCEKRDTKGLYSRARKGEIKEFTGIDSPFEPPKNPDIELRTDDLTIEESAEKILQVILPLIEYRKE